MSLNNVVVPFISVLDTFLNCVNFNFNCFYLSSLILL